MNRKKLSIDEQIMDMNSKGIIFIKQLLIAINIENNNGAFD